MLESINPNKIPEWAHWLAQDASGAVWAYEHEPNQSFDGWYENEVGRCQLLCQLQANQDWRQSLKKI